MGICVPQITRTDGLQPMKENQQNQKISTSPFDEELEIFGQHKTREQVRAEEKQRRKEERKELKEELLRQRKAAKEEGATPLRRKDVLIVSLVLAGLLLLCVVALANSFSKAKKGAEWQRDESRGHFLDENAAPDMSGEEPTFTVREAYFTNNGYLRIEILFGNGTDDVLSITDLDVQVHNTATNTQIAGGKSKLDEPVVVRVADITSYVFYISPKHVMDKEAVLPDYTDLMFDIAITHVPVEK